MNTRSFDMIKGDRDRAKRVAGGGGGGDCNIRLHFNYSAAQTRSKMGFFF